MLCCCSNVHPFGSGDVHNDCMAKLEKRTVNDAGRLRGSVQQAQVQFDMVILSTLAVHIIRLYHKAYCCSVHTTLYGVCVDASACLSICAVATHSGKAQQLSDLRSQFVR
jgi:hypothetical protein